MPTTVRSLTIGLTLATLLAPASLGAQDSVPAPVNQAMPGATGGPDGFLLNQPRFTLGLRAGFNLRRARSDIFDFLTDELTLDRADFNAFGFAGELGATITGPLDLVLGAGYATTSAQSEFRDYVDQNDLPITQRTTLSTIPLTAAARVYLTPRGRQIGRFVWIPSHVMPYVGAGAGTMRYTLEQVGSFVDVADLSIFDDRLKSHGWTALGMVMAGADFSLGTRVSLNGDARYLWANADLRQDFVFSDGIDLSGAQFSVALHVRI